MTIVTAHLTNKAYGFPTPGATRRVKAPILACIHITGNRRTAAYTDRHAAAMAERDYANRAGSNGPSAHYYVARDGWAIEAIDPAKYAAWSNGDVASPNTANGGIAKVLALPTKGYIANAASAPPAQPFVTDRGPLRSRRRSVSIRRPCVRPIRQQRAPPAANDRFEAAAFTSPSDATSRLGG